MSPSAYPAIRHTLAMYGGNHLDLRVPPLGLHLVEFEEADQGHAEEVGQRSGGRLLRVGPGGELLYGARGDGRVGEVAEAL